MNTMNVMTGLLLPESFLHSRFFIILATLVALNTVIYAALSLTHVLPHWFKASWVRGNKKRKATRSIYPDAPK